MCQGGKIVCGSAYENGCVVDGMCATAADRVLLLLLCVYSVHDQHSSSIDLYLAAISEKMHRTVSNNTFMFKTLR